MCKRERIVCSASFSIPWIWRRRLRRLMSVSPSSFDRTAFSSIIRILRYLLFRICSVACAFHFHFFPFFQVFLRQPWTSYFHFFFPLFINFQTKWKIYWWNFFIRSSIDSLRLSASMPETNSSHSDESTHSSSQSNLELAIDLFCEINLKWIGMRIATAYRSTLNLFTHFREWEWEDKCCARLSND